MVGNWKSGQYVDLSSFSEIEKNVPICDRKIILNYEELHLIWWNNISTDSSNLRSQEKIAKLKLKQNLSQPDITCHGAVSSMAIGTHLKAMLVHKKCKFLCCCVIEKGLRYTTYSTRVPRKRIFTGKKEAEMSPQRFIFHTTINHDNAVNTLPWHYLGLRLKLF